MKYKVNIHPHEGIRHTEGLEIDELYFGGRNIFLSFKNENKGIKIFLRDGDDPHRVMDQAFPACKNSYHYDNPNKEVKPLNYNEFILLKNVYEYFNSYNLGPEIYGEEKIRINSENYWGLIVEDLNDFKNVNQEEAYRARDEINNFLNSSSVFKKRWSDPDPSDYFKSEERGFLAVDLDWGLFDHDKVSVRDLKEFKGRKFLTLKNDEIRSRICFGTVGIGIEKKKRKYAQEIVKPNFEDYCEKQSYDFYLMKKKTDIDFENDSYDESQCETLFKIRLIEKLFEKGYEYVTIVDCFDALITNKKIRLESFIDDENSIFFSAGITGWGDESIKETVNINTGFAIYKNDKFTKDFLKEAKKVEIDWNDDMRRDVNDQVLFQMLLKRKKEYWNNIALSDPLQQSFWFYNKPDFKRDHTDLYKQHNSPFIWEEGDFMIHFAGQPNSKYLLEEFNEYLFE